MPRDGSGIYTTPPGTTAVPDTTIESAKYNNNVADVAADLNAVRPIIAGGTGGNSAATARTNLGAEAAEIQVTNYDSHAFVAGSFWSAIGATGAPNGTDVFAGYCTRVNDGVLPDKFTLTARSRTSNVTYVRQKAAGAWGAWAVDGSTQFVELAGDTMTGPLAIANSTGAIAAAGYTSQLTVRSAPSVAADAAYMTFLRDSIYGASFGIDTDNAFKVGGGSYGALSYRVLHEGLADPKVIDPLHITSPTHARVYLEKNGSTQVNAINGYSGPASVATNLRWSIQPGDSAAEGGGNSGSNFSLIRFSDAGASLNNAFDINRATGLMSVYNHLTVHSTGHTYLRVNAAPGLAAVLGGTKNGTGRWDVAIGDQSTESGGNVGSDFTINRYSDAGAYLGQPFNINRSSGTANFGGALNTAGEISVTVTGTNAWHTSHVAGMRIWSAGTASNGHYWIYDVTGARPALTFDLTGLGTFANSINANGHYGWRGTAGANNAQVWNFYWTGTLLEGWVQTTNLGNVSFTSDYRVKKDVADLPATWDAVKALRPVKYTHADFNPPSEIARRVEEAAKAAAHPEAYESKPAPGPFFKGDDIEHWGFIAHELQETLIPDAATGVKDSPDTIQSPNPWTVIAALTKALQEAMARIEALEAAASVPAR
jgi:hypothetical protein